MTLSAVLFIAAAAALAAASVFILTVRRDPATFRRIEALPRERISGTALTVVALLWCVPNIRPIFTSEAQCHSDSSSSSWMVNSCWKSSFVWNAL